MSTSREKMQQARELIQQKRYDEARAILRTVNHETALEWLDKIDNLDPPKVEQGATKRASNAPIAIGILVLAIIVAGILVIPRVLNTASDNVSTSIASVLKATATGTIPPVPTKVATNDQNSVISKCLSEVYKNTGMFSDFQKSLADNIKSDNLNEMGSVSQVYMGDYCDASEAFQVAWISYLEIDQQILKNNMDKSLAWSRFLTGWGSMFSLYAEETATVSAYLTAQPPEVTSTP